MIKKHLSTYCS